MEEPDSLLNRLKDRRKSYQNSLDQLIAGADVLEVGDNGTLEEDAQEKDRRIKDYQAKITALDTKIEDAERPDASRS